MGGAGAGLEGFRSMQRTIGRWRALANAALVLAILAVTGSGMMQVARRHWQVQKTFPVKVALRAISGLNEGNQVRVLGIDAGVIERIEPPAAPGQNVTLLLRVDEKLRSLVRRDAVARVVTEGVVGARLIEIVPGSPVAPPLPAGGTIPGESPVELAELLRGAAVALERLDGLSRAAEKSLGEIDQVAATIRGGEGSLGKLLQDDEAYRKLVALSARSERTLSDLDDNLTALKRTWPLSRYFEGRSFYDRDKALFHPGAERDSQVLREDELFEPGRSVLTARGRRTLDGVATWIKKVRRPASEVVIAAFSDDSQDGALAEVLTQEQADAVCRYLVANHQIDSAGWFATRKIAAIGFGADRPAAGAATNHGQRQAPPPRRVEVILFTPQT
jgi:phospholipid/cholesterol/gamma-HCH transport system substrate-binding protein